MKVKAIDGKQAAGVGLLTVVLEHASSGVMPEGTWMSEAIEGRLMDPERSVWLIEDGGLAVSRVRLLSCPCECAEVTVYVDGAEVSRDVAPSR
ncbi:hypothetical protein GCM10011583_57650 [Streptomyces camponoticapitis]|uniref:Uncharacterized protein n=1 Tax=Streptomyces camponoticapitis TaxID=1616125 RepID=A0ABQ2EP62_9ACTN|nr:hypothetical protein [Streptomyces camponoticapitis]GGK18250.1 hypothetical protein GCM10011583_57650 [Streptomyces camponoticapitis]